MAREKKSNVINRDMNKGEKLKTLDAILTQIERAYRKGSIMKLGDSRANMSIETVPTDSISLGIALGLDEVSKSKIVRVYGPEPSGETTVALHMVTEAQRHGDIVGFINTRYTLDPVYARNIRVDIGNLYISQPDNGEQTLEITKTMVRSDAVDIVVVDSVTALIPKAKIDGEMRDPHVGLQARLMSQAPRKLTAVISESNCIVIFTNQLRREVGVIFDNPETTTGGRILKFYVSVRFGVHRIKTLRQGGEVTGNRVKIKVMKNKIVPPSKETESDIMFGKGISKEDDILDLAVKGSVTEESGTWFAYSGTKIGQERGDSEQYLSDSPAICVEVEAKVRAKYELLGAEEAMEATEAFRVAVKQAETETGEPAAGAPELV